MTNHEPSTKDEIPPLCRATFLSIDRAIVVAWIVAGLVITAVASSVTWAWSVDHDITIGKEQTAVLKSKMDIVEEQINKKLDVLINQTKE